MERKPFYKTVPFSLLLLPTLITIGIAVTLMYWHVSTRVDVSLTVNRAIFTIGGAERLPIVNSIPFESLTIEEFDRIEFNPKKVKIVDPEEYKRSNGQASSRRRRVVITGGNQATATFRPKQPGTLSAIWLDSGSTVTLTVSRKNAIVLELGGQKFAEKLLIRGTFRLDTFNCQVTGIDVPDSEEISYLVELPRSKHLVEFESEKKLVLNLTIPEKKIENLFPEGSIPVEGSMRFFRKEGKRTLTSLVHEGKITYPKYPKIDAVSLQATDFLKIEKLEKFTIEEISMKPEHRGVEMRLYGKAGYIGVGPREFPRDCSLTMFDILWYDKKLVFLFLIFGGTFTVLERLWGLYKEVKDSA